MSSTDRRTELLYQYRAPVKITIFNQYLALSLNTFIVTMEGE